MKKVRYRKLDGIRGIAFLNMIAFHAAWDLVYIYGFQWDWYQSRGGYLWQQGICWTFIALSGFCLPLGKHPVRRGLTVFCAGAVITIVTLVFMPQNRVVFGVLTLIGSCMMIVGALDWLLKKAAPIPGLLISALLFGVTRNVNAGWLGFEAVRLCAVPKAFYADMITTYLGFPEKNFYSTDYFSIIPWLFLFLSGYYLFRFCERSERLDMFEKGLCMPIEWIGKHSLLIYMIHQPVLYLFFEVLF